MKNLLALVGLVVVLVAGGGWYLGWYHLGTEPAGSGHRKLEVDLNTNKISEDLKKGRDAVGNIVDKSTSGKTVEGLTTSLTPPQGGWTLPQLPNLPTPPSTSPVEVNPDGSLKITIPPPPTFPGKN